jgi:hypothetical protein
MFEQLLPHKNKSATVLKRTVQSPDTGPVGSAVWTLSFWSSSDDGCSRPCRLIKRKSGRYKVFRATPTVLQMGFAFLFLQKSLQNSYLTVWQMGFAFLLTCKILGWIGIYARSRSAWHSVSRTTPACALPSLPRSRSAWHCKILGWIGISSRGEENMANFMLLKWYSYVSLRM